MAKYQGHKMKQAHLMDCRVAALKNGYMSPRTQGSFPGWSRKAWSILAFLMFHVAVTTQLQEEMAVISLHVLFRVLINLCS